MLDWKSRDRQIKLNFISHSNGFSACFAFGLVRAHPDGDGDHPVGPTAGSLSRRTEFVCQLADGEPRQPGHWPGSSGGSGVTTMEEINTETSRSPWEKVPVINHTSCVFRNRKYWWSCQSWRIGVSNTSVPLPISLCSVYWWLANVLYRESKPSEHCGRVSF